MPADRTPEERAADLSLKASQEIEDALDRARWTRHAMRRIRNIVNDAIRSAVSENNEECASQASVAGDMMARMAQDHPENSPQRDRCNARAREAYGIAAAIRSREAAQPNHEEGK